MKTPKLNQALLSVFTITILSLYSLNTQAQCTGVIESDSLELVALYNALDGDNWTNNDGWLVDPVSQWEGIILTNNDCWVRRIILNDNNLSGELPELDLTYLKEIQMWSNNL